MVEDMLRKYPIISDQVDARELRVILRSLEHQLKNDVPGDVVELGCYTGTTSLFISRLLQAYKSPATFYVYDSFEGLPAKTREDNSPAGMQFQAGELHARKQEFIQNFRQANVPLPRIHKAWFSDLRSNDLPDTIAFAFLDGDFYESIRDSLRVIEHKLAPHAVIVVDDYQAEALPGAARAVTEWLRGKPHRLKTEASLAVITAP